MNTKIKLNPPEPVTVSAPGQAPSTLTVTHAELREVSVRFQGGQSSGVMTALAPLGDDGKPVPYAQIIRKQYTPGETAALGLDKPLAVILGKLIPA